VWPDERVAQFVEENFVPVQVHVSRQAEEFQKLGDRYGAHWTPMTLVLDSQGVERHRTEGYLPVNDFLAQLELGLAKVDFEKGRWTEAERHFERVVDSFPKSDAAPEAVYWAGATRYKATHDASALSDAARKLSSEFADSTWTRKASVWMPPPS
jgi:TolA-binding protein